MGNNEQIIFITTLTPIFRVVDNLSYPINYYAEILSGKRSAKKMAK